MVENKREDLKQEHIYHKNVSAASHLQLLENLGSLTSIRKKLHYKVLETKEKVEKERESIGYIETSTYPLERFKEMLKSSILEMGYDVEREDISIGFIDRKKLGGDVSIKISSLIRRLGKEYAGKFVPEMIDKIHSFPGLSENIRKIEQKGMYLNVTFENAYLFSFLERVREFGSLYGHRNEHKLENVVMDYSSPNMAKSLHAGHIRSTVLGHVLGNIYEANGYTVHRMNHINDRGGFGVFLAGFESRKIYYESLGIEKNDMMVHIYTTFRLAQKVANSKEVFDGLDEKKKGILEETIGGTHNYDEFIARFQQFEKNAYACFNKLENGDEDEVTKRKKIVAWSLNDFQSFYDELNIHLDYTVGESFYADDGKQLVLKGVESHDIVYFTEDLAQATILKIENDNGISSKVKDKMILSAKKDIGSYVIQLPQYERYVVMKSDGSTIYATRDVGAVAYRIKTFDPVMLDYVVGQEQGEHFQKLFDSSKQLDYCALGTQEDVSMNHIPFGFYVNASNKKKLSSREGAANVHKLIQESKLYYSKKYEDSAFKEKEIDDISKKLAIGGIIYNDISKSRKQDVQIHENIEKTIQQFESSGGVYIVYAMCRGRSALKNYESEYGTGYKEFDRSGFDSELSSEGVALIKKIQSSYEEVKKAAEKHEPSVLAQYLFGLAQTFNAFYAKNSLIHGGEAGDMRAWVTLQAMQVMSNMCDICHIPVPERI